MRSGHDAPVGRHPAKWCRADQTGGRPSPASVVRPHAVHGHSPWLWKNIPLSVVRIVHHVPDHNPTARCYAHRAVAIVQRRVSHDRAADPRPPSILGTNDVQTTGDVEMTAAAPK